MEYLIFLLLAFVAFLPWSIARQLEEIRAQRSERDFMRYPLYTKKEIQDALELAQSTQKEAYQASKLVELMREKEDKNTKKHADFSEAYKKQIKEAFVRKAFADKNWNNFYTMIEANIAIRNGRKIKDAQNAYEDYMTSLGAASEAEKRYAKWLSS